jgi:hypothetical protein
MISDDNPITQLPQMSARSIITSFLSCRLLFLHFGVYFSFYMYLRIALTNSFLFEQCLSSANDIRGFFLFRVVLTIIFHLSSCQCCFLLSFSSVLFFLFY